MNLIISIGRNIGNEPMDEKRWASFQESILLVAESFCTFIPFAGYGKGIWDGITEESFTVIGVVDQLIADETEKTVCRLVSTLARKYGQESIAVTFGEVTLVGPELKR